MSRNLALSPSHETTEPADLRTVVFDQMRGRIEHEVMHTWQRGRILPAMSPEVLFPSPMVHVLDASGGWSGPYPLSAVELWARERVRQATVCDAAGRVWTVAPPAPVNPIALAVGLAAASAAAYGVGRLLGAMLTRMSEDPERREIRRLAEDHEARGYDVCAELPGWCRPRTFYGARPDIEVIDPETGATVEVVELENERSVGRSHARWQHRAFARWASLRSHHRYTYGVVQGGRGGQ